ncbi:MAG: hypothetical protein JNK60_17305, partial [Acidobacteria bacterium]|nr:hypothetical protein [Acidobacteriota bacterium]
LDERFATPTLLGLSRSGSAETREIAVSLLMSQATPEALKALATVDRKGLSRPVAASLQALQTRPILITPRESPKTPREQFRQAFEALLNGDDGPFERLVSSVPDGERDLVAVFGPADLPQLRAVRRHYAARGNQHAIEYYNQFSQILMTLVWRP